MTEALLPPFLTFNHLMSSQSGNLQDLAACSGHPSSFVIGSEVEPDSLSRQEFAQHSPLPSDMGLRFMTIPVPEDAHYGPESGIPHSPVYSNDTSLPTLPSSTIPLSSYPHAFQPGLTGPLDYPHSSSSYFPPNTQNYCMPENRQNFRFHTSDIRPVLGYPNNSDIKPFTGSYSQSPVMAPPSRSPNLPHLNAPSTTRELYTSATPQLRRDSGYLPRSPSASINMRGAPVSPSSSSGFASPANMEIASAGPPLNPTELVLQLQTTDGTPVRAEILGKVDKGFFMADNDWTCYRRNYFQLSCSFTLHPLLSTSSLQIMHNGSPHQIHGFSVSIAAVVDGRDGRAIDLVQHTPKRDKGPQVKPERVSLAARPHPVQQYGSGGGENGMGSRAMYDHSYHQQNSGQPPVEYTYERIQFKCATANNGRRRAAQQYYHLLVELSVDIGAQMGEAARWVKIAQRISAPVVVRGRSPGHYHAERRHSNASAGGSAGPNNGGGSYEPNNGMQRSSGSQVTISGTPSMVASSGYTDSYESRSHHYSRAHIEVPMEPIMSAEEIKAIDETDGYLYYPSPIFEGIGTSLPPHTRPHINVHNPREPHGGTYQHHTVGLKIKQEPGYSGYNLPSLTAGPPADSLGRHFGRFEGLPSSKGYYPTVFTNPELHTQ